MSDISKSERVLLSQQFRYHFNNARFSLALETCLGALTIITHNPAFLLGTVAIGGITEAESIIGLRNISQINQMVESRKNRPYKRNRNLM